MRETQLLTALSAAFRIDVVGVCRSMTADPGEVIDRLGVRSVDLFPDEARRTMRRQRYSAKLGHLLACEPSLLEHVDLVHVEGGYLFHLLPPAYHDRTCLVEHNIESDVLRQIARITGSARLMRASHRVARLEERVWRAAAIVAAVTAEDQTEIARRIGRTDVRVVPSGADHIDRGAPDATGESELPTALFLANYAYAPNADALGLLLSDIWPAVHARLPEARLVIAGSGLADLQRRKALSVPHVDVVGFVPDLAETFERADVLVCPLRAGGGVKVKVLEALRRGCPVVTTTIGAQGVQDPARSALMIVDSVDDLVDATTAVLGSTGLRARRRKETLTAGASLTSWRDASAVLAEIWWTIGGAR